MATEERWIIASSGGDYTSLDAAWTAKAVGRNLVTDDKFLVFECRSSAATPDGPIENATNEVSGITTDATHYVHFLTPQAFRHTGIGSTGYRMQTANSANALGLRIPYVKIEGLSFEVAATNNQNIILINSVITATDMLIEISECYFKGRGTAGWTFVPIYVDGGGSGGVVKIRNCIIENARNQGIYHNHTGVTVYAYHVTCAKCATTAGFVGAFTRSAGTFVVKNCIAAEAGAAFGGSNDGFIGAFDAASTFNLSSDISAPGSNAQTSKTVTFVDGTNNDFHIGAADTVAKDISTANLVADAIIPMAVDIDGQTYPVSGNVSIGADQLVAAPVFPGSGYGETQRKLLVPGFSF